MDYDAIVVGAGPGGSLAARELARQGLKVGLFDRDGEENLGKTIIVEVERSVFKRVDAPEPAGDDVPYHAPRTRVYSGRRRYAFTLHEEHPAISVYLSRLAGDLLRRAKKAGADFQPGCQAVLPLVEGGAVAGMRFKRGGELSEVRARVTIDATGFDAALTRRLSELGVDFDDDSKNVVIAENRFHRIVRDRAIDAVKEGRAFDNEIMNRLTVYGNYSTEFSHLSLDTGHAYILIGLKQNAAQPPIADLIDRFREEHGFFGEEIYGGKGPIRVRRSLDRLVADGFMTVGEAACMVIPAHGSGVASAMYAGFLAGRAAARALAENRSDTAALWPYAAEYQRGRGAVLAYYDVSREVTESLGRDQVFAMIESGAMQAEDAIDAAYPRAPRGSLSTIPARALAVVRTPSLARPLINMVRTGKMLMKHYQSYPQKWDSRAFTDWKEKSARIFSRVKA